MELNVWVCDTCNVETKAPYDKSEVRYPLPPGWATAATKWHRGRKVIHICPGCREAVIHQLSQ